MGLQTLLTPGDFNERVENLRPRANPKAPPSEPGCGRAAGSLGGREPPSRRNTRKRAWRTRLMAERCSNAPSHACRAQARSAYCGRNVYLGPDVQTGRCGGRELTEDLGPGGLGAHRPPTPPPPHPETFSSDFFPFEPSEFTVLRHSE
ncbi:hypothetical protein SKAU_G00044860 [Synaphobranchus kaupii]|uniref:Uncharacterized protein n=1 Tax=Synaphobranchus kaupii TaxID=118154 RepID=A0A9Q1J833_SYNKA|nr:hypothetical protein SKAU_G00044860 [Synaphobranchus kaupii]